MTLPAPAKINLSLRVVGKRPDGFHEIETVMVPVSLADEVTVDVGGEPGIRLTCDVAGVPVDDTNLIVRAARVFFDATGLPPAVDFDLAKKIPWGAGLGGGSSDAAAALRGLDLCHGTALGQARLEEMAGQVGSDAPWFIAGQPAVCRGRGEILEPLLPPPPRLRLLLVKPPFGVPTPWAYQRWSGMRPPAAVAVQTVGGIRLFNDLEAPVFEKFLLLPTLKSWLGQQGGVRASAMSGSGSTVFAVLEESADTTRLEENIRRAFGDTLWLSFCETGTTGCPGPLTNGE